MRTINGLSAKIIGYYEQNHGRDRAYRLLSDEREAASLAAEICREVTGEEYPTDSTVKDVRTAITYVKNMMLTPEEIEELDAGVENFPEIYRRYCGALRERRAMDYDDQMAYALMFLGRVPPVLEHFRDRFRYICVDEAQDTSRVQHEIIKILAKRYENLFMVGDEDQSIYGFRAAYPDALAEFEGDHPGARVLLMERNFRSAAEIVSLAGAFVAKNRFRREKSAAPDRGLGGEVRVVRVRDRETQYRYLLAMAENAAPGTAILYRNNDSALPLLDLFERRGIGYACPGFDDSFFTHRVIGDIRALVRFAGDRTDAEDFLRIYYKLDGQISRRAALFACERSRKTGNDILRELLTFQELSDRGREKVRDLALWLPRLSDTGAGEALDIVWNTLRYGRYVEKNRLDSGKLFILKLLGKQEADVGGLFRRLDELRESLKRRTGGDGAVILSTVHSAKGLEYDHVWLLDAVDGVLPSKIPGKGASDRDVRLYEEERRLYYVAMTRARDTLSLFSCRDAPSAFTDEARAALPTEAEDREDVFSFLRGDLLDRTYTHRERGRGRVTGQCRDNFLVEYDSGGAELMTAARMMAERDTAVRYVSRDAARTPEPPIPEADLRPGDRVVHRKFGPGTVTEIALLGREPAASVRFDATGETKRFVLSAALKNGLLRRTE